MDESWLGNSSENRTSYVSKLGIIFKKLLASPGLKHWENAMRVFEYLNGAAGVGLMYKSGASRNMRGYVDASHTSCLNTGKMFMSAGAPVSWARKRVNSDSLCSCETEYMGLTLAAQEASYIGELKGEMYGVIIEAKGKCALLTDS